jgi:hypothetical protein
MCDPGLVCTELSEPLPARTPKELGELLQERHWNAEYAAAIRKQFGDEVLFQVLYRFITDTNRAAGWYRDQWTAAEMLVRFQPKCNLSLTSVVRETLKTWDGSIKDWPLFLWRHSSHDALLRTVADLDSARLTVAERENLEIWQYWLNGDEQNLTSWEKR